MSTIVGSDLVVKLRDYQVHQCLSDEKFGDKLGVSPELWRMTRTGRRNIGITLLKGIMRAYPELEQDVLLFLLGDAGKTAEVIAIPTTPHQTAQDKNLAPLRAFCHKLYIWCGLSKQNKPPNRK